VVAADSPGPVDPAEFRHVIARFATGVSVVSTVSADHRYGMTVNSLTSVSLDPVLVLFCCDRGTTLHDPVLATGRWGVSILSGSQREVSARFAKRGLSGDELFDRYPCRPGPWTGAPLLDDAIGWLECRTWATYDGGDHTIVVGEVLGVAEGADADALLYFESTYRALPPA
jgi:flavin reductase (DIM6/NTAB) family NADH-FMN oxidoreductase RutF